MKKQPYNYGGVEEDLSTGAILAFLVITAILFIGSITLTITINPY